MSAGALSDAPGGWDLPSTGRRIGARFVDAAYALATVVVLGAVVAGAGLSPSVAVVGYLLLSAAVLFVELTYAATPGQLTLGMHNVRVDSGRPDGPRTLGKNLLIGLAGSISCGILPVIALLTRRAPLNRTWFDSWTDLVVVNRRSPAPGGGDPALLALRPAPVIAGAGPVAPWEATGAGAGAAATRPDGAAPDWARPPEPAAEPIGADVSLPPAPVVETATVISIGAAPVAPSLCLDNGVAVPLDRPYVLGRDPVPPQTSPNATPLPVQDPTMSISKTHLLIAPERGGAVVSDLHSTNGVRVTHADGSVEGIAAGRPVAVEAGSTITFGQRSIEIRP